MHFRFLLLLSFLLGSCSGPVRNESGETTHRRPNIIYIMADDLGWGDLGCYGQPVLKTPRIDQLAQAVMRFTDHYSGHTVCRPSRLVLWTGKHSGHTALQSNAYYQFEGGEQTVVELLQQSGYATAGCGKWAMGRQASPGHPNKKGFDDWFGYLDQGDAHNYYPTHLWHNDQKVPLDGNVTAGDQGQKAFYSVEKSRNSHDVITDWLLDWIRAHQHLPFLMHAHLTVPHANHELGWALADGMEMSGRERFSQRDWTEPEKGFAAMLDRLDRDVGRIVDLLDELNLSDNTLLIFTSDNGPHSEGGHSHSFFNSNGPFRGHKRDLLEGGIRVPFIARWPGKIEPGSVSSHLSGFQDFMPTACQLAGVDAPGDIDGLSYLPTLLGQGTDQAQHDQLYWRFKEHEALRSGQWKLMRSSREAPIKLHDLATDQAEQHDLSGEHPEVMKDLVERMNFIRNESQ